MATPDGQRTAASSNDGVMAESHFPEPPHRPRMPRETDAAPPDGRCGYTTKATQYPERGRLSCWRPTHSESNRCVWHAAGTEKSFVELATAVPESGERLDEAVLRGLSLGGVEWFRGRVLLGADFADANLEGTDFSGADLRKSSLDGASARDATFETANLEDATAAKADFRDANFQRARFDHVDFTGTRINEGTTFGTPVSYESEMVQSDDPAARREKFEAALATYKTLETLADNHALYTQANGYYRRQKDLRRRFNWTAGNYLRAVTAEVSRVFTGYGIRPWRVIVTSLSVILFAALLYLFVGGVRTTSGVYSLERVLQADVGYVVTAFLQSLYFSTVTFTTLGYGNIVPASRTGRYLAGTEALVGSILLALLVAVFTKSTWLR